MSDHVMFSAAVQRRYEKYCIAVAYFVVEFTTQFPVRIVNKNENSRPNGRTLDEHLVPAIKHVFTDPHQEVAHSPWIVRVR